MKSGAKRRIAILTHEYYPVLSGGTVFAEKMALEWSAMGYEAEILTSRIGGAYPAHEQSGISLANSFSDRKPLAIGCWPNEITREIPLPHKTH